MALARWLDELEARIEKKLSGHDEAIAAMLSAIRELMPQRSTVPVALRTGRHVSVPAFAQCDATSSRVASIVCAYPAPAAQRGIGFTADIGKRKWTGAARSQAPRESGGQFQDAIDGVADVGCRGVRVRRVVGDGLVYVQ